MATEDVFSKYEAVIGLEVHAQMLTQSKAYSSDANVYGDRPNTNVSAITLALPGTLPKMNKKTIEYAIKLGLALDCDISDYQYFDRKNYFYPDLPNGYQITQSNTPICTNGKITLKLNNNQEKVIRIERIHMEEDTGKSLHDVDVYDSLIDLNRAGTPLLEIVTEPDLRNGEEAYEYLFELRQLVRYLDICDGNMEEGNLRCDANVSVRKKGASKFGVRVEVKNMNSMRNVQRAINYEIHRHIELLENNEVVLPETRTFDALNARTIAIRSKSESMDYRFFPEPNLPPLFVSKEELAEIKSDMPVLPKDLLKKYTQQLKLSEYDAKNIISSKSIANYYEQLTQCTNDYKAAANWLNGEVRSYLNREKKSIEEFPISPDRLADLISLINEGKVSNSAASQNIFPAMLITFKSAEEIAEDYNLIIAKDDSLLINVINEVIKQHSKEAERYKNGEKQLLGFFMGQVMKSAGGKIDPKTANSLIRTYLDKK